MFYSKWVIFCLKLFELGLDFNFDCICLSLSLLFLSKNSI